MARLDTAKRLQRRDPSAAFGGHTPRPSLHGNAGSTQEARMLVSLMRERLWKIGDRIVDLSQRGMIMGVLNVTPDSFSDGSEYFTPEKAVQHGVAMAEAGAEIIDIGGESTRPRAQPVGAEEELRRVLPVVQQLRKKTEAITAN